MCTRFSHLSARQKRLALIQYLRRPLSDGAFAALRLTRLITLLILQRVCAQERAGNMCDVNYKNNYSTLIHKKSMQNVNLRVTRGEHRLSAKFRRDYRFFSSLTLAIYKAPINDASFAARFSSYPRVTRRNPPSRTRVVRFRNIGWNYPARMKDGACGENNPSENIARLFRGLRNIDVSCNYTGSSIFPIIAGGGRGKQFATSVEKSAS